MKLPAWKVTSYAPGGSPGTVYWPSLVDVASLRILVLVFRICTWTFGMTAPELSVKVPVIVPRFNWPKLHNDANRKSAAARKKDMVRPLSLH